MRSAWAGYYDPASLRSVVEWSMKVQLGEAKPSRKRSS